MGKHHVHPYSNAVLFRSDHRRDLWDADHALPLPRAGTSCCLPHACFRRTSPQRFRFRGLWRKPGQRFAVCGENPAWRSLRAGSHLYRGGNVIEWNFGTNVLRRDRFCQPRQSRSRRSRVGLRHARATSGCEADIAVAPRRLVIAPQCFLWMRAVERMLICRLVLQR